MPIPRRSAAIQMAIAAALGLGFVFDGELVAQMAVQCAPRSANDTAFPWGPTKDGLRTRLVAAKRNFEAGEAIPVKLEVENTTGAAREYFIRPLPNNESLISVVDERRRPAAYLGRLFQFLERPVTLRPGETLELAAFDLANSYYLRQPGQYTARFAGDPPSAALGIEIVPNEARATADGDAVGQLLPLVKPKWWLGTGEHQDKLQPGSNWGEVRGRIITFVFNPPQFKEGSGMIWICLADEAAPALPPESYASSSKPTSQYWGKIGRWHVYANASQIAINAWPAAKQDIITALATEPKRSSDQK